MTLGVFKIGRAKRASWSAFPGFHSYPTKPCVQSFFLAPSLMPDYAAPKARTIDRVTGDIQIRRDGATTFELSSCEIRHRMTSADHPFQILNGHPSEELALVTAVRHGDAVGVHVQAPGGFDDVAASGVLASVMDPVRRSTANSIRSAASIIFCADVAIDSAAHLNCWAEVSKP